MNEEEGVEKIVEENSPVVIPELVLDLKRTKLDYGQLKKGMVSNVDKIIITTGIVYQGEEKNEGFALNEFYFNPQLKDLFIFEEGGLGKEKAYLVETALKLGRVEINKNNFLTVAFYESLEKKFKLFYLDKDDGGKKVFEPRQFGAKYVLEGNPKENELLVLRRGCLTVGDNNIRFAYLAVGNERESYLLDKEGSFFKRFKNFCQKSMD